MPRSSANPPLGYGLVVAGAGLFIVNSGVTRVALRGGVDPTVLTTVRVTGAAIVVLVYALVFRLSALRPPTGRAAAVLVALGVVGVAGVQWAYNVAIDRIPVGIALLLEYLAPVLVVVWARVVQGAPTRPRMWVALLASLVGLAVVSQLWQGLAFDGLGMAAGLLAAVCFAAYFLLGEHGVGNADPVRVFLWSFVVAAVAMNLVRPVWTLGDVLGGTDLLGALADLSAPVWVLLLWIVVLGTVVPFGLELLALQHLSASSVTIVAMLEPVGATALGWAWFAESLDELQVAGAVLVLVGIALAQTARISPPAAGVPEVAG